jgi:hypothetical protein
LPCVIRMQSNLQAPSNFGMYFWVPALFRLGLLYNPTCDGCKQAFETASHVLCDCEALPALKVRHRGQHFEKPSDFDDISVSRVFVLCSHCWAVICMSKGLHKTSITIQGVTLVSTLTYSVLGVSLKLGALTLHDVRGAYLCHCTCFRHVSPIDRWYSLNNKWLCVPPSESGEKQLCLSRRIVRELSRLISVTYLELILWCRVYGVKIHKNLHFSSFLKKPVVIRTQL